MAKTVALVGTLDTKGPEIAYLRDRCQALGLETLVVDSGILGEPLGIEPDFSREVVAAAAGSTIEALRHAGSRGAAVHEMMKGVRQVLLDLYGQGRLNGVACLGGAEGAVMGAHAMQALPIGLPKLLATPIASGKRHFGPLTGLKDVMVIHSVVDILGLNPISYAIFDNMAAALKGMADHGHVIDLDAGERYVAITMLGNTTKAVMAAKERLAEEGLEAIIFHANGVGGPAMEELAEQGLFSGVIDFTTDELTDELVGGFHNGGPNRLRVIGRLGLPQVVVPGCIDFSVHGPPEAVPDKLRGRPMYTHNPVFTLVRTLKPEMVELGRRFAERLNESTGPLKIAYPTRGLSIPSYPPDGVFWDAEADAAFMAELKAKLRPDIPILEFERHVNAPEFGIEVAELFLQLINGDKP
ncbi:MAG TPA: Tm-1-like ATP-binding domain-containing protein [Anaerolineae bacterium]|nr:Tm-1-like ATP-binding domain-containing protein [Anaerolineae bacterium]HMR62691.1 Tm-1-like ATP-binding domain-containing protein [Anaerolineae bacterium]